MLPDPLVKDGWRGKDVLWYPAKFLKRRPHARNPNDEFEFRYFDCIDWRSAEDILIRPSRHCNYDRASCEEMLNFQLRQDQVRSSVQGFDAGHSKVLLRSGKFAGQHFTRPSLQKINHSSRFTTRQLFRSRNF